MKRLFKSLIFIPIFVSCLTSCDQVAKIDRLPRVDIPVISHRGFHVEEIENTIGAFIEAGKRNFFAIETDIHWTKDNHIICHHDSKIKEMDNNISEYTYEEILNQYLYEKGKKPVKVPLFSTFLKICKEYNKIPVVELKGRGDINQCKLLIHEIANVYGNMDSVNDVIFMSFDNYMCSNIEQIRDENNFEYDIYKLGKDITSVNEAIANNWNISLLHTSITEEINMMIKEANLKLSAWTINNIESVNNVLKYDLVSITSDLLQSKDEYLN